MSDNYVACVSGAFRTALISEDGRSWKKITIPDFEVLETVSDSEISYFNAHALDRLYLSSVSLDFVIDFLKTTIKANKITSLTHLLTDKNIDAEIRLVAIEELEILIDGENDAIAHAERTLINPSAFYLDIDVIQTQNTPNVTEFLGRLRDLAPLAGAIESALKSSLNFNNSEPLYDLYLSISLKEGLFRKACQFAEGKIDKQSLFNYYQTCISAISIENSEDIFNSWVTAIEHNVHNVDEASVQATLESINATLFDTDLAGRAIPKEPYFRPINDTSSEAA